MKSLEEAQSSVWRAGMPQSLAGFPEGRGQDIWVSERHHDSPGAGLSWQTWWTLSGRVSLPWDPVLKNPVTFPESDAPGSEGTLGRGKEAQGSEQVAWEPITAGL